MITYSHSRLSTYEQCKLKYKYQYIDKIEVEEQNTIEAFLGSRVHETLEKLYTDIKFEKHNSLKDLLKYFNDQWQKNWDNTIKIIKQDYTSENYRLMGERFIKEYYETYKPFTEGKILGLETQDRFCLDTEKQYYFHIRIDRFMQMDKGIYEIHDYKTNNNLPLQEKLDEDRQLAMYSMWVKETFKDAKKIKLVWHFLAFNKEMQSERTTETLTELKKEVIHKINEIEHTKDFFPNITKLCDWCIYKNVCPEWKHEFQLEQKSITAYKKDDGLRLVNKYVDIKEQIKSLDDQSESLRHELIEYAKQQGITVVFGADNKISIRESETLKFPTKNTKEREELITLLKKIDMWDEVSDIDTTALTKLIQQNSIKEKELDKIKKYVTPDKIVRLSISKKRE